MIYYNENTYNNVYSLMLEGFTNSEIGERLDLAVPTIKKYVGKIFKDNNVTNRNQFFAKRLKEKENA